MGSQLWVLRWGSGPQEAPPAGTSHERLPPAGSWASGARCWKQAARSSPTSTSKAPWPLRLRAWLQDLELGSALHPCGRLHGQSSAPPDLQGKREAVHAMWQVIQGLGHHDWPGRDAGPPWTPTRRLSELPPTSLKSLTRGCWSVGRLDPRTGSRALPRPLWTADTAPGLGVQGADFPRPFWVLLEEPGP